MQLIPAHARLKVPGSGRYTLRVSASEELVSWTWQITDVSGNPVPFLEWGKEPKAFKGFRWMATMSANTREIVCPDEPVYGLLNLTATVTYKDKSGVTRTTKTPEVLIKFIATWGGVAKANYPYPDNSGIPWDSDKKGRRALVLMFDLINQMPQELRAAAGSIPITRNQDLSFASGFHAPYVSDSILIGESYVNCVTPGDSAITPGDILFISTVLHEIAHAVSYQKSSVNVHGVLVKIHKALRSTPFVNLIGWPISVGLILIFGLYHSLLFGDFVSGFAKVAGWELTAWYLHVIRRSIIIYDVIDFGYLLAHWNEENIVGAVHPNVITGWWVLGNIFWLKNLSIARDGLGYDYIETLKKEELKTRNAFYKADNAWQDAVAEPETPEKIAALRKLRDQREKSWKAKRNQLNKALRSAGVVSQYASTDVLEDIAETVTAVMLGANQLNAADEDVFVTQKSSGEPTEGFARRLNYLMDAGLIPRDWTPLTVGAFMRGKDPKDQFNEWEIEL